MQEWKNTETVPREEKKIIRKSAWAGGLDSHSCSFKGNPALPLEVKIFSSHPLRQKVLVGSAVLEGKTFARGMEPKWLALSLPKGDKEEKSPENLTTEITGEIRLSVAFQQHNVYPLSHYTDLLQWLLDDPLGSVEILQEITVSDVEEVAQTLVKIYEAKNKAPIILNSLLSVETKRASDVDTLFRANTIASKAIDMFMKLVAHSYLEYAVGPTVSALYKEKRQLYVQPEKHSEAINLRNWKVSMTYLDLLFNRIYASTMYFPNSLRIIFSHLINEVQERFPENPNVRYIGVSGFLFLRFISAALLGPKLFDLVEDHPDPHVAQNLTFISKTVMRISSMVETNRCHGGSGGGGGLVGEIESYISSQQSLLRSFIDKICVPKSVGEFNPASVNLEKELSTFVTYLETNLEKLKQLYLTQETKITSLDNLVKILDDMSRVELRRKPVRGNLFTERRSKGLPCPEFLSPIVIACDDDVDGGGGGGGGGGSSVPTGLMVHSRTLTEVDNLGKLRARSRSTNSERGRRKSSDVRKRRASPSGTPWEGTNEEDKTHGKGTRDRKSEMMLKELVEDGPGDTESSELVIMLEGSSPLLEPGEEVDTGSPSK
eukprot:TRINITY_DN482_c0_g2_i4.p1 TRINITY_DN482_c0_g2~~TRINITY_DN482_c0_g2_i4.p1  ORF type:complete len:603 (-),score=163.63 TRINITY_DN482_c0_g2_i4:197-2005(-)